MMASRPGCQCADLPCYLKGSRQSKQTATLCIPTPACAGSSMHGKCKETSGFPSLRRSIGLRNRSSCLENAIKLLRSLECLSGWVLCDVRLNLVQQYHTESQVGQEKPSATSPQWEC